MNKNRMEAFSDNVIAIVLTIMVLDMRAPMTTEWKALLSLAPVFLSYILSFVYIGIYWNNHHHLLQATKHVNGKVLWANLHLLFWITLIPFVTTFMGENHLEFLPVALYGTVMFFAAIAYHFLSTSLIKLHGEESLIATSLGKNFKGWTSLILYGTAVFLALEYPQLAIAIYVIVALMWLIPDSRIEKNLKNW